LFRASPSPTTSSMAPSPHCTHHGSRWTTWSSRGSTTPSLSSYMKSFVTSQTPLATRGSLLRASSLKTGRRGHFTSMPSSTCSPRGSLYGCWWPSSSEGPQKRDSPYVLSMTWIITGALALRFRSSLIKG
jgi:hypothetical protein